MIVITSHNFCIVRCSFWHKYLVLNAFKTATTLLNAELSLNQFFSHWYIHQQYSRNTQCVLS